MAVTLPPVSLSSGPALSGGPTTSGDASTGDFVINRGATLSDKIAFAVPVLVLGALLWLARTR